MNATLSEEDFRAVGQALSRCKYPILDEVFHLYTPVNECGTPAELHNESCQLSDAARQAFYAEYDRNLVNRYTEIRRKELAKLNVICLVWKTNQNDLHSLAKDCLKQIADANPTYTMFGVINPYLSVPGRQIAMRFWDSFEAIGLTDEQTYIPITDVFGSHVAKCTSGILLTHDRWIQEPYGSKIWALAYPVSTGVQGTPNPLGHLPEMLCRPNGSFRIVEENRFM